MFAKICPLIAWSSASSRLHAPLRYQNGFDVRELSDAVNAQLSAEAGGFHAAEGQARIGGHHFIDEHHTGFDLVGEALALLRIIGPGAGAEAKPAVVDDGDRLIDIFDAKHTRHRTEQLFA